MPRSHTFALVRASRLHARLGSRPGAAGWCMCRPTVSLLTGAATALLPMLIHCSYVHSFVDACNELGYGCCFTVVVLDPSECQNLVLALSLV